MATRLYCRDTTLASYAPGTFRSLLTAAGANNSGSVNGVVNTVGSGTEIVWTKTAGGAVLEWVSPPSPAGGWTLAGTVSFTATGSESNTAANVGFRAKLYKRAASGAETLIGTFNRGVELTTSIQTYAWTGTPTSTVFAEDDRLVLRLYATNAGGTMAGSRTATLYYDGAAASFADTRLDLTETVAFKSEPTGVILSGLGLTARLGSLGAHAELSATVSGLGLALGLGALAPLVPRVAVTHALVVAKSEADDPTLIRPSDWNDPHEFTMAGGALLGRSSPGDGPVETITVEPPEALSATGLAMPTGMALLQSDAFTANGTWTRHAEAVLVLVQVVAGGGAGGSGATESSPGTGAGGGAGGGAGQAIQALFAAPALSATESVVVGAQTAATVGTVEDPLSAGEINGVAGAAGNPSAFGARLVAYPGQGGHGGWFGDGGITRFSGGRAGLEMAGSEDGIAIAGTWVTPGRGGEGSITDQFTPVTAGWRGGWPWLPQGPGGGGGGAGIDQDGSTDTGQSGGAGFNASGGGLLQAAHAAPTGGAAPGDVAAPYMGSGGNGGDVGLNGGDGTAPGGGGGGGGAGGNGGRGARGEVRVYQFG